MQNTKPANDSPGVWKTARGENADVGKFLIIAYDYPRVGNSGGWSKSAKHKPQPVLSVGKIDDLKLNKRRKFTAFDLSTTPPTLIRRDYSLEDIRKLGGNLPPLYFDELGNMRDSNDKMVMAGPSAGGVTGFLKT